MSSKCIEKMSLQNKEFIMNPNTSNPSVSPETRHPTRSWLPGVILILIGVLTLAGQLIKTDWFSLLFLPALGIIFLGWGIGTHKAGLLIPGGILAGIGCGAILIEGPYQDLVDPARGGVFLLAFSAGWALITVLSAIFTQPVVLWPLIPGGFLALIGGGLLAGETGLRILEWAGKGWPIVLIAIGLYLILWRRGLKE
jgi:hypothetical protein